MYLQIYINNVTQIIPYWEKCKILKKLDAFWAQSCILTNICIRKKASQMISSHGCYLMLLYCWRGCVQGPEYTSKYGNLPKYNQKMFSTILQLFSLMFFAVSIIRFGPWTQPLQYHGNREYHLYLLGKFLLIIWSFCSLFLYLDINPEPWTQPLQPHCNIHQYSYFSLFFSDFLAIFPDFRATAMCRVKDSRGVER